MISFLLFLFLGLLSLTFFSFSTDGSTCTSKTFSNNRVFHSCDDLHYLNSTLHWTYSPSKSSFSAAFVAPPPKPTGWIAWAINPTAKGMIGAQSLIASRQSNGSMTVQTFDIKSYGPIQPSPISISVSDLRSEFSNGVMTIFATVQLPNKNETTLNQVWQVGSSVTDGIPDMHDFEQENLKSIGTLDLLKGEKEEETNNETLSDGGKQQQDDDTSSSSSQTSSSSSWSSLFLLPISFSLVLVAVSMLFRIL